LRGQSVDELDTTADELVPRALAAQLRRLLEEGAPLRPIDVVV
jgi:hypothetical protein